MLIDTQLLFYVSLVVIIISLPLTILAIYALYSQVSVITEINAFVTGMSVCMQSQTPVGLNFGKNASHQNVNTCPYLLKTPESSSRGGV